MVTKIITTILILDLLFFLLWALSGQIPTDNFHAGIISKTLINLIIK